LDLDELLARYRGAERLEVRVRWRNHEDGRRWKARAVVTGTLDGGWIAIRKPR
jgi:hypothetical protein